MHENTDCGPSPGRCCGLSPWDGATCEHSFQGGKCYCSIDGKCPDYDSMKNNLNNICQYCENVGGKWPSKWNTNFKNKIVIVLKLAKIVIQIVFVKHQLLMKTIVFIMLKRQIRQL